ncbi:putative short chain dehydrogenase reductase protein [Eutypa lata UCREL1]|uniref:Putative short chain dehydrogenase reductase protein n=1 Tax=Eutypa lata (strain UCR-EL1) TaxID=1287681 RepID=M7TC22_EUTLA|nr:putative short chain dehydrogenase reductase protein [Eutypa lata UCREL1]
MASSSIDAGELFAVKGLVAVVTGGGTGIGLMIAQALEANGAIVYIIGRRKEVLEKAATTAKHGNIHEIQGDVTSKADLARAADKIKAKHGYVNVVVANSGVTGPSMAGISPDVSLTAFRDHLWNWDPAEFNKSYEVNATAVFYTLVAFLELLDEGNKRRKVGQTSQFIALSSIGAYNRMPFSGYAYGSSKAAVVHMMKQLATALVPYDIRTNVIAPGLYPSDMTPHLLEKGDKDGWPRQFIPAQRAGDIQDSKQPF